MIRRQRMVIGYTPAVRQDHPETRIGRRKRLGRCRNRCEADARPENQQESVQWAMLASDRRSEF